MLRNRLFRKFFTAAAVICLCFSSAARIPAPSLQARAAGLETRGAPALQSAVTTFFNRNLYLDNVELSRYTYFTANARFGVITGEIADGFLVGLTAGDQKYEIRARDIGFKSDSALQLSRLWAYSLGETPGAGGMSLQTAYTYDGELAGNLIDKIVSEVCPDGVPASAGPEEPNFDFESREFTGAEPEPAEYFAPDVIRAALEDGFDRAVAYANEKRAAPVIELKVEPSAAPPAESASGYGLLSAYSTNTTAAENRNTNITLACEAMSGTVMAPGDVFSFLGAVGDTTREKGYKVAGILVNGKPAQGIGGGICQVSSTLYNAVLDAGLKVVERHPHSAPVNYVPKGRDATVSLPRTDFRFRNDTGGKIYIVAYFAERTVTVELYGALRETGRG